MSRVYVHHSDAHQFSAALFEPLGDVAVSEDDLVVNVGSRWTDGAATRDLIARAVGVARASGALAVVLLDERGEELSDFFVTRGSQPTPEPRSQWFPLVLERSEFRAEAHRSEAEQYRDRIGDRLLRPDLVEADKQHLIADDRQRAARVLDLPHRGRVLDVGTSDGTLFLEAVRRWDLADAVGVDVAPSAVQEATAAARQDPRVRGHVTFHEAFIEQLAFADGAFDTISACETLEHIGTGQFAGALENLIRMLRPGGDLFITVPNRYPEPRYEREGRARWAWPAHHQFFTELSVRHLLTGRFDALEFFPLYDGERPGDSIYLICRARGRQP